MSGLGNKHLLVDLPKKTCILVNFSWLAKSEMYSGRSGDIILRTGPCAFSHLKNNQSLVYHVLIFILTMQSVYKRMKNAERKIVNLPWSFSSCWGKMAPDKPRYGAFWISLGIQCLKRLDFVTIFSFWVWGHKMVTHSRKIVLSMPFLRFSCSIICFWDFVQIFINIGLSFLEGQLINIFHACFTYWCWRMNKVGCCQTYLQDKSLYCTFNTKSISLNMKLFKVWLGSQCCQVTPRKIKVVLGVVIVVLVIWHRAK